MLLTQNLECVLNDMVAENVELQQQLQSKTHQLIKKEAELTRAAETISRVYQLVQAKDSELAQAQLQMRQQVSLYVNLCTCVCDRYVHTSVHI